jgi:hypothetical protein
MFKLNRERRAGFSEVESQNATGRSTRSPASFHCHCNHSVLSIQYKKVKIPERRPSIKTWTPRTQLVSITVPSDSPRGARTTLSTTSPIVPHHHIVPYSASTGFPIYGAISIPSLDSTFSYTYRGRYGWRHQIGPWVRAGYRVIAPDMLGYGGTDKPRAAEEYSTRRLCADLAALLDVVGVHKAVSAGVSLACDL